MLDDPTDFDIFGNSKKLIFNNTKKLKILVATHCFTDAIHFYGKCLFPDFFEWLKFLGELSKNTITIGILNFIQVNMIIIKNILNISKKIIKNLSCFKVY